MNPNYSTSLFYKPVWAISSVKHKIRYLFNPDSESQLGSVLFWTKMTFRQAKEFYILFYIPYIKESQIWLQQHARKEITLISVS